MEKVKIVFVLEVLLGMSFITVYTLYSSCGKVCSTMQCMLSKPSQHTETIYYLLCKYLLKFVNEINFYIIFKLKQICIYQNFYSAEDGRWGRG